MLEFENIFIVHCALLQFIRRFASTIIKIPGPQRAVRAGKVVQIRVTALEEVER
jgi:hypothetical protein